MVRRKPRDHDAAGQLSLEFLWGPVPTADGEKHEQVRSAGSAHWQQFLPARYSTIEDPQTFFSTLGKQVAQRVADVQEHLLTKQSSPPAEDHFAKVGRWKMAKLQAEEAVLAEMVLPEQEAQAALGEREEPLRESWRMPMDWELVEAEQAEEMAANGANETK